jgi:hypothetical protein
MVAKKEKSATKISRVISKVELNRNCACDPQKSAENMA